MKEKHNVILIILFCLTALLVFAPFLQQNLQLFTFKQLTGYKKPAPKPVLNLDNYVSGTFQTQEEQYLKEHFGFREPLIRMYNQWTYDWFKTTSNKEINIGKDGWLYHTESALQYYGNMESWFDLSNSQVRDNLISQTRSLAKVNAILKEYDVELLTFTLPTKSYIYPEHLRKQPVGDTTFNATLFYEQQLDSLSVPHINMTSWFQQMQDTIPFDLFYSKGSHWAAGAPIAVDSMLRYMEQIGGQTLTHIQLGRPYSLDDIPFNDFDLEMLLNLAAPLKHEPIHEYPVSLLTDNSTTYPSVWFVGTSFYWYMTRRVNFDVLFSFRDLLFYDAVFYTDREQIQLSAYNLDYLHELLLHNYVVFFRDGPQLYTNAFVFPGKALISLCISDERLKEKTEAVADSIIHHWQATGSPYDKSLCYQRAELLLQQHPEMFEELRGEGIPTCRNPRIGQVLTERNIRADRSWSFLLNAKGENDSIDARSLFKLEAGNVFNNKPLLRDKAYLTTYDYFDFLVKETMLDLRRHCPSPISDIEVFDKAKNIIEERIRQHAYDDDTLMQMAYTMDGIVRYLSKEEIMESIRKKAKEKQISIDKAFRDDVVWCFRNNKNGYFQPSEEALLKAFTDYQIERKMRRDKESKAYLINKHRESDLPLRIVINRNIEWKHQNRITQ